MNSLGSFMRSVLVAGTVGFGAVVSTPLFAVQDVLETPSAATHMADRTLLLDIEKVGSRLVAVGVRGHIILSDDQGKSWRQAEVPVSVLLTAVDFVSATTGWAVGHGGVILKTTDGGASWKKQFDGNIANKTVIDQAQIKVGQAKDLIKNSAEPDLELLEAELEEAEFALQDAVNDASVGASKPFLDVLFLDESEGIAVGAYGFLFKTKNGGQTWTNHADHMDNPDRFHLNGINQIKGGTLIVCGEGGVLFRSTNRGDSWQSVESPYEGSFFSVTGTNDANAALVFGLRGHIFRSDDGGMTWDQIETGTDSTLVSADFYDNGYITVVGTSGTVLLSSDGGRTFKEQTREDRSGNSSVVFLDRQRVVIVGEKGAMLAVPGGESI